MITIDGKTVAAEVYKTLAPRIEELRKVGTTPGVGVVVVGDRPESAVYVGMKRRRCEALGITCRVEKYAVGVGQKKLEEQIELFNADGGIHGILIQLPLPDDIDQHSLFERISREKDVDAFHPHNAGLLSKNANPRFVPCTPRGCLTLLDFYGIEVAGKDVTVIGASNLVGLPLSLLLTHRGATVTTCHILTKDVRSAALNADIVIACCGSPGLVKGDWVKRGAVVIDVGINKVVCPGGHRLVGDTEFDALGHAAYASPVPGGVGPMTIASLVSQVVESAERAVAAHL